MEAKLKSISNVIEDGNRAKRIEQLLAKHHPELLLDPDLVAMLKHYRHRAENAQAVKNVAAGRKVEAAEIDGRTATMGWVFKKGDSPIHVSTLVLDGDKLTAKRTTFHELTHLLTPRNLDMGEDWRFTLAPLFRHLKLPDEAWKESLDAPIIEGYVEGKTAVFYGADDKVLYTHREVPFVQALERMGQKWLNVSFKALFFSHQVDEFKKQLILLCLMLKETAEA